MLSHLHSSHPLAKDADSPNPVVQYNSPKEL